MAARRSTLKPAPAASGVFDLDAVAAEATSEPFAFQHGGRTWTLPHLQDSDARWMLREGNPGDQESMREMIQAGLGDQYPEFMKVPLSMRQVEHLFRAWTEHSGVDVGESGASSGS